MKQFVAFMFAALLLATLPLAGCGGGGSNGAGGTPVVPSNKGDLALSVKWPARTSRLIPVDANDVLFTITPSGSGTAQTIWVPRPAGTNSATSTVYSQPLLPGSYTIRADAYEGTTVSGSNLVAVGASLSTASIANEMITAGATTPFNLTLGSTLSRFLIQGFPYYNDSSVTSIWVAANGTLTTNSSDTNDQSPTSLPINSAVSTPYVITVTPEDANGDVLLLSSSASGQTTISASYTGSGNAINVITTSSTTTQNPPSQDQYTFDINARGLVAADQFTITYADGSTSLNFPVAVSAVAPIAGVTLTVDNTPPDFNSGGPLVSATAQLTEIDSNGNVIQVFNGVPTFSTGSVTFAFGSITSTTNRFWYTYSLNLLTVGGAAVPVVNYTSSQAYVSALSYPGSLQFPTHDATGDNLALTFPSPSAASALPVVNAVTFNSTSSATPLQVTATFGSVTGTFSPSLFVVTPGAPPSPNLYSYSSGTLTPTRPTTLPYSLSTQTATVGLQYQTAAGTIPATPAPFDVYVLPNAGTVTGTAG